MCGMAAGSGDDLYSRIGSHCAVITCADGAHSKRSDMLVEGVYKDYKDFSGVKFPTTIIDRPLIVLRVQGFVFFVLLVASDRVCLFARLGQMRFPARLGAHRA